MAIVPSLGRMLSRDQSLRPETWILLGTSGNVFDSPRAVIDSSPSPYQGMLHSWNQNAASENPVRESTGKLVSKSEVKKEIETPFQRRDLQVTINQEIFLSSRSTRILWLISKDCKSRSFILANSPHIQRFHVGRWESRPKKVLVPVLPRKQCYGSKK